MKYYYEYKEKNGCKVGGHNLETIDFFDDIIRLYGVDIIPTSYDYEEQHWGVLLKMKEIEYLKIEPMLEEKKIIKINEKNIDRVKEYEKIKSIMKECIGMGDCGLYNTRNIVGDNMQNLFQGKYFSLDICYEHSYFEVFGMTDEEYELLKEYYDKLKKELKHHLQNKFI